MRQERLWKKRHDTIAIDGKARLKSQPDGPLPPTLPPKPALLTPPSELSLAYLSDAVYTFKEEVAGWELKGQIDKESYWLPGKSHAALYAKSSGSDEYENFNTKCAIVFSVATTQGFDGWTHGAKSDETLDLKQCKLDEVHKGMLEEWQSLVLDPAWATQIEAYAGSHCHEMFTGGHAIGGALASIEAACANGAGNGAATIPPLFRGGVTHSQGQIRRFMNVTGLYTFGAPAVSKVQLTNNLAEDSTFAGGRFYNEDKIYFDPVPFSGSALGLLHPMIAAIRLEGKTSGWINRREFDATSADARREPDYLRTPLARDQEMGTYLERVHMAPLATDLTVQGLMGRSTTTQRPENYQSNLTRREVSGDRYTAKLDNDSFANESFELGKNTKVEVGGWLDQVVGAVEQGADVSKKQVQSGANEASGEGPTEGEAAPEVEAGARRGFQTLGLAVIGAISSAQIISMSA